jgi:hypothetical protein
MSLSVSGPIQSLSFYFWSQSYSIMVTNDTKKIKMEKKT